MWYSDEYQLNCFKFAHIFFLYVLYKKKRVHQK